MNDLLRRWLEEGRVVLPSSPPNPHDLLDLGPPTTTKEDPLLYAYRHIQDYQATYPDS